MGEGVFENLLERLHSRQWLSLETTPGKSATFDPVIERVRELDLAAHLDAFTVTDNPLAKLRYGSLFGAIRLQNAFKKPVLATLSMRDRNLIGLQSDLLGCNEADIRSFLVVTGDPASLSDQPHAKGVFEANSIELLKIMSYFNRGIDNAGKAINPPPKAIYPFAVTNAYAKNPATLKRKMQKKIENGALGLISQPVFSLEDARRLMKLFEEAKAPYSDHRKEAQLILGLFPLTRLKTAQFISAHVPGIHVPDHWLSHLFEANKSGEEAEKRVGLEMSQALFQALRAEGWPVHLMTANRFENARALIDGA
jgi:5,10-methylenetetrahydrofolate reductase